MIVFETFQSHGCDVLLEPVYPNPIDEVYNDGEYERFDGKVVNGKASEGLQFVDESGDDICEKFSGVSHNRRSDTKRCFN